MSEFKQGDMIQVSDIEFSPINTVFRRKFVVFHGGMYFCESNDNNSQLRPWTHARAIPKPKRIPYTAYTFPKGVVFVRHNCLRYPIYLITSLSQFTLSSGNERFSYKSLAEHKYELSTDNCKTWQPASEEVL